MVMKPDPKIKAQMVLFNWIRHRKGLSNKEIAEMLGHSYPSTVSYCMNFRYHEEGNWKNEDNPILMCPECFLWNWQDEACDYLTKNILRHTRANIGYINSIIADISGSAGHVTEPEAAEWARDIDNRRLRH